MEFVSTKGVRFSYWFTAGEVIKARSWVYRGIWRHDVWVRNDDGTEWHVQDRPLGIQLTRGQRLAFAWCAAKDAQTAKLVAVKNCATGESRAISSCIATSFGLHRYGRAAFIASSALAAVLWFGDFAQLIPAIVGVHPLALLASMVAGTSVIGYFCSCASDPDPGREIDRNVHIALEGMRQAWVEVGGQGNRRHRIGSRRHGGRTGENALERAAT